VTDHDDVISLCAKGLTTGEIAAHLAGVYGAAVSRETISKITDAVLEEMTGWFGPAAGPHLPSDLHRRHPRQGPGRPGRQPSLLHGDRCHRGRQRDILGIWAGRGGEGAKFWLGVLTELRNRGVIDVCIVVCDGLKGLPDAIATTLPLAVTHSCVLHLIR
jgi:putative transposase